MTSDTVRVVVPAKPLRWCTDEESARIAGLVRTPSDDGHAEQPVAQPPDDQRCAEQPARLQEYVADAKTFALSFCRDFRALHQLNHDHDCTSTCIKYVQKKCKEAAEEALRRGRVVACRFFFFHIVVFACEALANLGQTAVKRIRRRGKKPVETAYVASTNDRNEFCKVSLFDTHRSDRRRRTWGKCGVAATLTSNSCLAPWIRTRSLR